MKKLIFALTLSCCATAYAADAVPFKAAIHTDIEFTNSCGPACISLFITGTGQGSHFGRMVIAGPSQIVFDATGVGAQTGTSTLTAADGSTVDISFEGMSFPGSTPDAVTFEGDWTVVSGTGRFQEESGSGTYEGSAAGPIGVLYLNGTLSNPGREKK
jgi:hypothetical protein